MSICPLGCVFEGCFAARRLLPVLLLLHLRRRAAWEGLVGLTSALHLLHSSTHSPSHWLYHCFKHCLPLRRLA